MTHITSIGTISHGTLANADLLEAFGWELQHIEGASADHLALANEARQLAHAYTFAEPEDTAGEDERASELVGLLQDALNEHAPPYCYFGTLEGDGSDFGFWPIMEAIEELPSIQNVEGEDLPDEDHKYVNDHGNVTVYAADGTVILDIV